MLKATQPAGLPPADRTWPPSRRDPDAAQFAHIPGWGADIDPADRPAVPKERLPARNVHVDWHRPAQQPRTAEVLVSPEHRALTPVFGSTVPPRGASGWLRRLAFRWSESDLRHWLLLLAADRVDVVEGVAADLSRGHVPNLVAEMGLKAEWRHNRPAAVKKLAIGAGVLVALAVYRAPAALIALLQAASCARRRRRGLRRW